MSRTAVNVRAELLALAPQGRIAWRRDAGSNLAGALLPLADGIARFEAAAEAQPIETDPRHATLMLGDYERVLGPDPCGRDLLGLSVGDRQRVAWQRWVSPGGQTPAFYVALAAGLGTTITITEQSVFQCGVSVCGDDLAQDPEGFAWLVTLPTSRLTNFEAGGSECGDVLGDFAPNLCECVIRLTAPAHTQPVFSYIAP